MVRNLTYVIGILILLSALYVSQRGDIAFVPPAPEVEAADAALSGYAWSGNIGWISFNCETGGVGATNICATSNYAVTITTNDQGNSMPLTGYAWSANIGWIKFGGLGTPPVGTNSDARIESGKLLGWARACAVFVTGCSGAVRGSGELGGWDGWISLHSDNGGGGTYGVSVGIGTFSSYAWGSDVVGWLSFSGSNYGVTFAAPCAPDATFQCTAAVPSTSIESRDQWCRITTSVCANGTECVMNAGEPSCDTVAPTGSLTASQNRVRKNATVSFTWTVSNIGTCEIRGTNGDVLTFDASTAPPLQSSPIVNETSFELVCTDVAGLNPTSLDTERITVLPTLEQF